MFLSALNKEEKELFLELAFNIAMIDGVYSDEEKVLMGCYCQEMQITFNKENMTKSTDEIIKEINNKCDSRSKKIMIFKSILIFNFSSSTIPVLIVDLHICLDI